MKALSISGLFKAACWASGIIGTISLMHPSHTPDEDDKYEKISDTIVKEHTETFLGGVPFIFVTGDKSRVWNFSTNTVCSNTSMTGVALVVPFPIKIDPDCKSMDEIDEKSLVSARNALQL